MKSLFLVGLLIFGFQSWANPYGGYYTPFTNNGDGSFSPEHLAEISSRMIRVTTVHNGAKVAEEYNIRISGNKIIMSRAKTGVTNYDCNGEEVVIESDAISATITFQKNNQGLVLSEEGESFTMLNASEADISRINSLPLCKLK